jgi:hypothetical protein
MLDEVKARVMRLRASSMPTFWWMISTVLRAIRG